MFLNSLIVSKKSLRLIAYSVVVAMGLGCSGNNFESFSDTTENIALLYAAKEGVRDGDYTSAISACTSMPASYLAGSEASFVCASAYAGRCGYTLMGVLSDFQTYASSLPTPTSTLFQFFATQITSSSTTQLDDCHTAEGLLRSQGTAAQRSDDENAFMVMLSIWKMSKIVNETADKNGGDADDGSVPGGFDACASGDLSDQRAEELGSAFWELSKSLAALSTNTMYTDMNTAINDPTTGLCTVLNALSKDICTQTDPTSLNAAAILGARSLVKEGSVTGIDQCAGGSLLTCNCP